MELFNQLILVIRYKKCNIKYLLKPVYKNVNILLQKKMIFFIQEKSRKYYLTYLFALNQKRVALPTIFEQFRILYKAEYIYVKREIIRMINRII